MMETYSFGYWVQRRRKALDLTRAELANRVGCATETIKKIERDERRPSRQIAILLANALNIPPEDQALFLQVARRERSFDRLKFVTNPFVPLPTQRHNLPVASTSFIGRQADITGLKARLEESGLRLITITGPGGIGKTRLALQVASLIVETYPGGVWLVELAGLSNPTFLARQVSIALGVSERPNREFSMVLVEFLQSRPGLLLVLDNCEHLLEACADLASQLLKSCPNLQILATSRQALGVWGETIWQLSGLSLAEKPDTIVLIKDQALDPYSLPDQSEAMQLFIERARLVQPHYSLTSRNFTAIAKICQELDGIPLAIELAAARLNVLSAEEITARLGKPFQFLRSRTRGVEERHQALHAVIGWSYSLLNEAERLLFNRLSVFRGGFTLDAAEAVGGSIIEGSTVLDLLAPLVEKSMVSVEIGEAGGTRYRLLETLRLYGQECLIESGEVERIRQRHVVHFTQFAEEADPRLRGTQQVAWLETIETEHDNLRTALEWASNNDPESGLRLVSALWWFWITRGYFTIGREWMEKFLSSESASTNVKIYVRYAYLLSFLLDNLQLFQLAEEGLRRARLLDDPESMAISLLLMAGDSYYADDAKKSSSLLEESLALFRQNEDKWGMATVLKKLAEVFEVRLRNHSKARKLSLEAIALFREIGDLRGISHTLILLGDIERRMGNWNSASSFYQESYSYNCQLRDRYGMAGVLWNMGWLAEFQNDYTQAIKLRESSLQIFREIHHHEMTTLVTSYLAYLSFLTGQNSRAFELCHESLKIAQETNSQRAASDAFLTLGEISLSQGETTAAFQHFRDYFANLQGYSLTQSPIVYGLEVLSRLAISQGKFDRAVKLLSVAETLRNTISLFLIPKVHEKWEGSLNQARAHLNEAVFAAAWEEGQALAEAGLEQIMAYAMGEVIDVS